MNTTKIFYMKKNTTFTTEGNSITINCITEETKDKIISFIEKLIKEDNQKTEQILIETLKIMMSIRETVQLTQPLTIRHTVWNHSSNPAAESIKEETIDNICLGHSIYEECDIEILCAGRGENTKILNLCDLDGCSGYFNYCNEETDKAAIERIHDEVIKAWKEKYRHIFESEEFKNA